MKVKVPLVASAVLLTALAVGPTVAAGQTLRAPVSRLPPPPGLDPAPRERLHRPYHDHHELDYRNAVDDPYEACEPTEADVSSGEALVAWLQSLDVHDEWVDYGCLIPLFDGPEDIRLLAFREENVTYVMEAAAGLGTTYDGDNSENLGELFHFLRAAYYNEWNVEEIDFTAETDRAFVAALDAFVRNAHFLDATNEHGMVLHEVFVCLDSLNTYRTHFLPAAKDWLTGFGSPHTEHWDLIAAVNSLFTWLYRGHWDDDFLPTALSDDELMNIMRDLALSDHLLHPDVEPDVELLLANAARELSRFIQYADAAIYSTVHAGVGSILDRYDPFAPYLEGGTIWLAAASVLDEFDQCSEFDICEAKGEIEDQVLSMQHSCSESTLIRSQSMTSSEMDKACKSLVDIEALFHAQLNTGHEPVADDLNTRLEVIVFADWTAYSTYSYYLFGNETNNGGIYLEGDPSDPSSIARFFAYIADWVPDTPVWNLEHEYVHYLDGRFNLAGGFEDYLVHSHKTVWWLEGLAEFLSQMDDNQSVVEEYGEHAPTLSRIMAYTYNTTIGLYENSHMAVWFMFTQHREDVDTFTRLFRAGDYDAYLDHVNETIGDRYDDEWRQWLENRLAADGQ